MNGAVRPVLRNLNDCGCCEGLTVQTPVELANRPGLTAIAYRVGTHARFRQGMLARLSSSEYPALAGLQTRDDDDFSIALLDAWATVADVLTFYQDRIANESYLRTATERRSLLELARLIGYELGPGVAASTYLAFTLEDAQGAPGQTTIAVGIKVQSIPGPDEKPQTFETVEKIEARAEWNALRPKIAEPQKIYYGQQELYLKGVDTQLQPGDAILIVGHDREVNTGSERWDFRILQTVETNPKKDYTHVTWEERLGHVLPHVEPAAVNPKVFAMRQRAALFGHNAPDPRLLSTSGTELGQLTEIVGGVRRWKNYSLNAAQIDLDTTYPKILLGSWIVLVSPTYVELSKVDGITSVSRADFSLSAKVTRITPDILENPGEFDLRNTAVFAQSELLDLTEKPVTDPFQGNEIVLDCLVSGLAPRQPLIVSGKRIRAKVDELVRAGELTLVSADGSQSVDLEPGDVLKVMEPPSARPDGTTKWHLRDASGFEGTVTIPTGSEKITFADATKDDATISEIAFIRTLDVVDGERTKLVLKEPLDNCYDRATVTINANVAAATHGETVQEILGSGDASRPYQRFTLHQSPLTHVSAETASGAESTLQVRVNDVLWREVQSLYGRGPEDHVFVSRTDDEGKTTIQFGDGVTGARLPTGQDNVRAVYRKGIGLEGLVKAEQLTLLMTRPLGVKGVTNPLAPTGADDRESLGDARRNAPLTVLTLDRTVSLQDYEDFARAFVGIAKALATWTLEGQARSVFVTVAGPKGNAILEDSKTYENLLKALRKAGDPYVKFRVKSYRPAFFRITGSLKVNPDLLPENVLAVVEKALRTSFSFDAREFVQPVMLSEVIAVIQAVPGVEAVDVDKLYRTDEAVALNHRLLAAAPETGGDGEVVAAELLMLDPAPLDELGAT